MFSGYEIMLSKYSNVEKYPLNSDKRKQLRNKIIVWLYTKEDTLADMKSLLSGSEAIDIKRNKVVYFLRRNDYKGDLSKLNTEELMLSAINTCLKSLQEKKDDFLSRKNDDEESTAVMDLVNNTRNNDEYPDDISPNISTLLTKYGFSINQLSKLGFKDRVGEVLKGEFSVQVTLKERGMDSDNEKDKLKIKRAVFRELLVTYQKNRLTPKVLRELLGYEGDNVQKNPDLDWEKSFVADQFRFFSPKDRGTFSPKSMKNPLIRALSMLSKEEEYSKVDALMLYKLRAKLLTLLTKGPETPANQFLRAVYSPLRDNREEQEAKKVELIPDIEIANYLLNQSDILSRIAQSLNRISPEDNRTPNLDAEYVKEYLKIVTAKGERDLLKKGFLQNGFPTLYHTTKSKKTFEQIAQNGYIEMSGTETHPSRSTQTETYAGAYGSTWPELEGGKYGFAFAAPEDNWPKFRSKADGFATWLGFSNRINLKSVCFVYADVSLWRWRKGNKLKTCTVAGKVVPKFKPSQVILLAVAVRQAKAEILDDKADAYQVDPMHWFQQHELANVSAHIFNHHNYELFLKMESKDIIELLKVISDDDMNEILGGFSQYQMIKNPELKLSTLRNPKSLTTLLSGELSTRAKSDIEKQYVLFNRVEQLMKLRAIDF